MNFQRGRSRDEPEMNLVPLIDVLMVILIFLMVTTTYARFAELQINLPQAAGEASLDKPAVLNIAVDATGHYTINGKAVNFVSPESFGDAMKLAAGTMKEPVIIIGADASATHQSVINIMEAARMAGLTHITFTTQAKPAQ
jgi:biopolymer transport protein ExbD